MPEYALPRSDEPFDFRRQAASYGRFRRDYSAALYDAIAARTGPAAGRLALDVGCGTGFVTRSLAARGWRVVGVDFSAPMLAGTAGVRGPLGFVRATAEALPVADGAAAVVTSGTAFHWFAPRPTLAEFRRALAPGGWVVLFWRYPAPGEPYMAVVAEVAARFGRALPFDQVYAHPEAPFHGSGLDARPPERIQSTLAFTAESFHGYISTVETFRRLTGEHHGAFLDALAVELRARWPQGFEERNEEFLFLAQKPA